MFSKLRYGLLLLLVLFYQVTIAQVDINAMEYFIDTDPGIGSGISIPVTTGSTITESFTVATSALSEGFHTLYIRVQDLNSVWSITESRSFYVSASRLDTQADIQLVEYFIDTDPGIGAGTSLSLTVATDVIVNDIISTSALPAGFHTLYTRSQDSDGIWGNLESRSFYISPSNLTTQATITALEYFIDSDPGYGAGVPIPVAAATNLNVLDTLNTSSLAAGHHTLHVRVLDGDGIWSEVESRSFFVDAFAAGGIAGVEYFFDADPGIGSSTTIAISPVKADIDSIIAFSTTALSSGPHVVGIRLINENGLFGMTEYLNVTLCDGATASILADTVCVGAPTALTDISSNVVAGDIFSWDFDNDGSEDSNSQGDQTFTFPTAGTYYSKLSIDRSGCTSVDSIEVIITDSPIANAGADQAICTTATILAADPLNVNEVGTWSVFAGSATILDPSLPNSDVTTISTNNVELIWQLVNTVGGCIEYDTVLINANLPITAQRQTETVDIGQTANINVPLGALINPGDLLTTTIQSMPLYGIATVLADGTIDYDPDLDAPTLDSLLYRITNQCTNFAEAYAVITINNAPPAVNNAIPEPTPGTNEVQVDLNNFISDPNNNIDLSSLSIITQPISGATASIDASGLLTIDYTGITFSGDDILEIQICDLSGVCVSQSITIPGVEVGGENPPILVFNGVSPDGDGFNDFLEIENIEAYPNNTVIILSRWGAEIDRFTGYNNQNVIFNRTDLPSGTYYYHILPGVADVESVTGHFLLINDQ